MSLDSVINTRVLANPFNWLSLGVMIVITCLGALVVYSHATSVADFETAVAKDL